MDDNYINYRVNQIMRQRAAMGGYDSDSDYGGCDYGGILLGGAIKAALKSSNPWIKFVAQYAKKHDMGYGEAIRSSKVKKAYAASGKGKKTKKGAKRSYVRRRIPPLTDLTDREKARILMNYEQRRGKGNARTCWRQDDKGHYRLGKDYMCRLRPGFSPYKNKKKS